jgi:hypothetical protein
MIGVRPVKIAALGAVLALAILPAAGPAQRHVARPAPAPAGAVPECPAEQLSCGRQVPVVSDGIRLFENEDLWLRMWFPRGSLVCMARSGDAPRGFFAIYGPGPNCAEHPDRQPRFISLYGGYNAMETTRLAEAAGDCPPLSTALRRRLGGEALALPNYPSLVCETATRPGSIEIVVHALAGPWRRAGSAPGRLIRSGDFFAALGTTPAHFDEDLARFRQVLRRIRIGARP